MRYRIESSINSLFVPILNPGLRHVISHRMESYLGASKSGFVGVVNLYSLINDAIRFKELWGRLGWSYDELKGFRQVLNNYSNRIMNNASDIEMMKLTKFVSDIDIKLSFVTLLINDDNMERFSISLSTHKDFQGMLTKLAETIAKSEKRSERMGRMKVPGLSRSLYKHLVNVITEEDKNEIVEFLRSPEQAQLITNLLAANLTEENMHMLAHINIRKRLIQNFYAGNKIAGDIMCDLYLGAYTGFVKEL